MKKVGIILALIALLFGFGAPEMALAISDEQASVISQSCSTIKQSLKNIQKTDSRTRSYLGSIYQTLLTNYITPLNLSLVKNNQPSTTITSLYSDFLTARKDFGDKFTTYSQNYEELLNIDCKNNPEGFYNKLAEVRKERVTLDNSVKKIRTLLSNFYTATSRLKEEV